MQQGFQQTLKAKNEGAPMHDHRYHYLVLDGWLLLGLVLVLLALLAPGLGRQGALLADARPVLEELTGER